MLALAKTAITEALQYVLDEATTYSFCSSPPVDFGTLASVTLFSKVILPGDLELVDAGYGMLIEIAEQTETTTAAGTGNTIVISSSTELLMAVETNDLVSVIDDEVDIAQSSFTIIAENL